VAGSTGGPYKLPKYLPNWKDPEDGFAQTTNVSQMKMAASCHSGPHNEAPWDLNKNLMGMFHPKDSLLIDLHWGILKAPG
jgi:hypothetical protein